MMTDSRDWNVQYGPSIIEEMFVKLLPVAYEAALRVKSASKDKNLQISDEHKTGMAKEVLRLAEIAALVMDEKEGAE